jgi:DNA-binding transcriptional regulator PaaX
MEKLKIKKFLIENFFEVLERTEFMIGFLAVTAINPSRSLTVSYSKLQQEFIDNWEGGEIKKTINRLIGLGYLKRKEKDKYFFTNKSLGKLLEARIKRKIANKQKIKNKYLVLIFDIPENERATRDTFRRRLKILGFELIQQSVWISQYDVLEELKQLIDIYRVNDYVKFFVAEKA